MNINNISIIIPLYNKEKSISNTINSVLNQKYNNYEIIIVNDGSTDNSLNIIRLIINEKIIIYNQLNKGVSAARNYGITKASFKWIAFLDADDLWEENHLVILNNLINKYPNEMVFATSLRYSSELKTNLISKKDYVINNYFREVLKQKDLKNKEVICSSCCLINRKCFAEVGFFKEKLSRGEDLEMWSRLGRKYNFVKSKVITAIYRLEAENRNMNDTISFEKSFESRISLRKVNDKYEYNCLKSQIRARVKSYIYRKEWVSLLKVLIRFNYRLI